MYDDTEAVQASDPKADEFHRWLDLHNTVQKLEYERNSLTLKLEELRPRLNKLGQKIADMVCPQDKPADPSPGYSTGDDDW